MQHEKRTEGDMGNNCPCEVRYNATKGIFYYKTGLSFYHKIVDSPHRFSVYYCLVQVTIPWCIRAIAVENKTRFQGMEVLPKKKGEGYNTGPIHSPVLSKFRCLW